MLEKTHMAVGVATTLAITRPATITEFVLATGFGALGALISDIDVGTSKSHHAADNMVLLAMFAVAAILIMDTVLHAGIVKRIIQDSGYIRICIGVILFVATCAFGKEQPHRSFMHSILALVLLSIAIGLIWQKCVMYFYIGFLSHIAIDSLNMRKVRLLYPAKGGVCFKLFHAHGLANDVLFVIGMAVSTLEIMMFIIRVFS